MSVNKVILVGRLGKDPELRYTQSGTANAKFPVATDRKYRNKEGEWIEETEWHNIKVWGTQAENCEKFLSKGREVFIEGRINTDQYEDRDGNKRYWTEIVAMRVQFLGGASAPDRPRTNGAAPPASEPVYADADIPF